MHTSTLVAALLSAVSVVAQTPTGFQPVAQRRLNVTYNATVVVPGIELPQALVQTAPVLATNQSNSTRYMVALLDLSLPSARVNGTNLVPGVGTNRTTRLHWLQTNLTVGTNGRLSPFQNTSAAAPYAGPQPPQGDIPHLYAFFLFTQPSGFVVPAALANGSFVNTSAAIRNNFSLTPITSQSGVTLLEGNYIVVQNANNTGAATAPRLNGTTNGTTNGTATSTTASVPAKTNSAGKVAAVLPAVGLGALAVALL